MNPPAWDGVGWPDEARAWADHARLAGVGVLDRADHDAAYAALRAIVDGGAPAEGLPDVLRRLSIFWPPRRHEEQPRPEPRPLPTRDVARIALDLAPAVGDDAPRIALGPFAEQLDLLRPLHLRAWTSAVAAAAFLLHEDRRTPAKAWAREGRRPPEAERRRLHAVGRAPPAPWRLVDGEGGLHAVPLVPLASGWIPTGPVELAEVGGVDGGPRDGGLLIGRIVVDGAHAWARAAVVLPEVPSLDVVRGWFARIALPQLVAERGLEAEELLRRGAQRLSAEAHAWWWAARSGRSRPDRSRPGGSRPGGSRPGGPRPSASRSDDATAPSR